MAWEFEEALGDSEEAQGAPEGLAGGEEGADQDVLVVDEESGFDKGAKEAPRAVSGPVFKTRGIFETVCSYNMSEVPSVPTRMIVKVCWTCTSVCVCVCVCVCGEQNTGG